jgi:hypothetical protein
MKPHETQARFYSKLINSAEEALSHGSPRHSILTENHGALTACKKHFDHQGWETELLESKAKPGHPDYLGLLLIRHPELKEG